MLILRPDLHHLRTPPMPGPAPAPPPRSRPPAATAPARRAPITAERQGPRLPQRAQARPHRPAPPGPRGRGPRRPGRDDRGHDRGDRRPWRDRGPPRAAARHRLLEGRAGGADRVALFDAARSCARRSTASSGRRPTRSPPSTSGASTPARLPGGTRDTRCLKELRQLRKDALPRARTEPERRRKTNPRDAAAGQRRCDTTRAGPSRTSAGCGSRSWSSAARAEQDDRDPARLEDLSRRLYLAHTGQALPA